MSQYRNHHVDVKVFKLKGAYIIKSVYTYIENKTKQIDTENYDYTKFEYFYCCDVFPL
jgi:hypothetical protein